MHVTGLVIVREGLILAMQSKGFAAVFFDGSNPTWLPTKLLQGRRNYFGAHTYERMDKPRGEPFQTNWTARYDGVSVLISVT